MTRRHMAVAAMLLLVLAATVVTSALRLAGEFAAQDARFQFKRWMGGKVKPEPAAIEAAEAQLRTALSLDSGNPHLHSDLGHLLAWHAGSSLHSEESAKALHQGALEQFRQAAHRQPTASQSWLAVALTHYRGGMVDAEFAQALELALRWWPWKDDVQLLGIQLGLATWQALDEPRQRLIADSIRRQAHWKLVDQKPALIRLLRHYGRADLGCPWAGPALGCRED